MSFFSAAEHAVAEHHTVGAQAFLPDAERLGKKRLAPMGGIAASEVAACGKTENGNTIGANLISCRVFADVVKRGGDFKLLRRVTGRSDMVTKHKTLNAARQKRQRDRLRLAVGGKGVTAARADQQGGVFFAAEFLGAASAIGVQQGGRFRAGERGV